MAILKSLIGNLIDHTVKRRVPGVFAVYALARRIVRSYENNDVDMRTNGEHWLQSRLAGRGPIVAIDVGANQGDWVLGLLDRAPDCRVYCFEPVPTTFQVLQTRISDSRANLMNLALSSREGKIVINSALDNPYISSVHDTKLYDASARIERIEVNAVRGDRQSTVLGLSRVDVLKVDAEGHDFDVLVGFGEAVDSGLIDIIQFEYNVFTLFARHQLRDFFDLLGENYLICRLLPRGLEACGYHHILDDFRQSNWVAVRRSLVTKDFVRHFCIRPARGLPGLALKEQLPPMIWTTLWSA